MFPEILVNAVAKRPENAVSYLIPYEHQVDVFLVSEEQDVTSYLYLLSDL
jgi:hypothetical protein